MATMCFSSTKMLTIFKASSNRSSMTEQYVFINIGKTDQESDGGKTKHGITRIDKPKQKCKH